MSGLVLAVLLQGGMAVGDRVEALPWGTRWQQCTIVMENASDGGYGVRCDGGAEFFVAYKNVRPAQQAAEPPMPAHQTMPPPRQTWTPPARRQPAPAGFAVGQRVEALPYGNQWQACTITAIDRGQNMAGVRCHGSDMSVTLDKLRAPGGGNLMKYEPLPPLPNYQSAPGTGAPAPLGKPLRCRMLAGAELINTGVVVTLAGGSSYRDASGRAGAYVNNGGNIRFTSGSLAGYTAQAKNGGLTLFQPGGNGFGMRCD